MYEQREGGIAILHSSEIIGWVMSTINEGYLLSLGDKRFPIPTETVQNILKELK